MKFEKLVENRLKEEGTEKILSCWSGRFSDHTMRFARRTIPTYASTFTSEFLPNLLHEP